jgi:hypothetical protein
VPRRRAQLALVVLVAALAAACRRQAAPPQAPGEAASPRPTEAPRATYKPPVDGRLTKAQIDAYLGVLDRLKLDRSRRPASSLIAPFDPLDLDSPDVVAARARGLNTAEYVWVRERVLEAEAADLGERLTASHLAMLERALAELKVRRAAAPDEGSKKLLSEQIANFEVEAARTRREARQKEPDSVRANMKSIEPYRARLEAAGDVLDLPVPRAAAPARTPSPAPSPSR